MRIAKTVVCTPFGWCAEFYTDDDGASGYGEGARAACWYGTREACEAVTADSVTLRPLDEAWAAWVNSALCE